MGLISFSGHSICENNPCRHVHQSIFLSVLSSMYATVWRGHGWPVMHLLMDIGTVFILVILINDTMNTLAHEKVIGTHFSIHLGADLLGQRVGI